MSRSDDPLDDMDPYLEKPLEIDKICRVCLGSSIALKPLYGAFLDEMLMFVTDIQVKPGDGLPDMVCCRCILQISRSYTFKKQYLRSNSTLKKFTSSEFQEKLCNFQKPICETLSNHQIETFLNTPVIQNSVDVVDSDIIEVNEFELLGSTSQDEVKSIVIGSDLILNSSAGEETKSVSFGQTAFDVISIPSEMIDGVISNFDSNMDMQNKINSGIAHVIEINSDQSLHLLPKNNFEDPKIVEADTINDKHKCLICGAVFDLKVDLKVHMVANHDGNTCQVCGKSFKTLRDLKRHVKTHDPSKPFTCDICGMKFSTKSNLNKHNMKHTGKLRNVEGKPHLCSVCGSSFKWKTSLSKHSKYHTGNKLLSCQHCDKRFAEARSLKIHMTTHTGEKPYDCQFCEKKFAQKTSLDKHIKAHMGELYPCTYCPKTFTQKAYALNHMRNHTKEKTFACNTCGKKFTGSRALSNHRKIHAEAKSFQCATCQKTFTSKEILLAHQKSHCGDKPFTATICDKEFITLGHLEAHDSGKLLKCTKCEKKFATVSDLKLHMRSHVEETP